MSDGQRWTMTPVLAGGSIVVDAAQVGTLLELASLLRALRRRHARQLRSPELTYRELAAKTGWSFAAIAEYLTGRTLPPTDRFDDLVRLLGATPAEQWALATARDRVAEQRRSTSAAPGRAVEQTAPRQLPVAARAFVGREDEMAVLTDLVSRAATSVVVAVLAGTAGVGKTALAVEWAHGAATHFPDGQLYVNLRGYAADQPMDPANALAGFLDAMGAAPAETLSDVDNRSARLRSLLAGRRVLLVLDNASTAEQVLPLLPGTAGAMVLVTSRDSLHELVALHGAHRIELDVLTSDQGVALLGELVGPRVRAEPEAATALAARCARLPLALRVAAELANARPADRLTDLVAELTVDGRLLDALDRRVAVTAVFSWSVRHLPPDTARLFRALGAHPGPDLDRYAAAALADIDPEAAARGLDRLASASLIVPVEDGRYGMHDLLRAYAAQLLADGDGEREPARQRMFAYYLSTAAAAMDLVYPAEADTRPAVSSPATHAPALIDSTSALVWLDGERPALVALSALSAVDGPHTFAPALSRIMYRYLNGGRYADALTVHRHAVAAAERAGDRLGEAWARVSVSQVMYQLTQIPAAIDECQRAVGLFRGDDDPAGLARAVGLLGTMHAQLGRHAQSIDYYGQALTLHRRAGYVVGQVLMLYNLGCVEQQLGRHDEAERYYRQGLALAGEIGDDRSAGLAYVGLADVASHQGRHRDSAQYGRQAIERHRAVGDHAGAAWALIYVGNANVQLGDTSGGELDEALRMFTELGSRHGVGFALASLGDAARARGDLADSVTLYTDALAIGDAGELSELQAISHNGLGCTYLALGDRDQAARHWRRAVDRYASYGSPEADVVRAKLADLDL